MNGENDRKEHRKFLNEREAAELLCLGVRTLQRWRWEGRGPSYFKFGGAVRYARRDLDEFVRRSRRRNTHESV